MLNQGEYEIEKVKAKEKSKRQLELEKIKKELERHRQVEAQLQQQKDRFLVMRDLLDAGCAVKIPDSQSSDSDCPPPRTPSVRAVTPRRISDPKGQLAGTPNFCVILALTIYFRHTLLILKIFSKSGPGSPAISTHKRRSQSAERWVDHPQPLHMDVPAKYTV